MKVLKKIQYVNRPTLRYLSIAKLVIIFTYSKVRPLMLSHACTIEIHALSIIIYQEYNSWRTQLIKLSQQYYRQFQALN